MALYNKEKRVALVKQKHPKKKNYLGSNILDDFTVKVLGAK